MLYFRSYRNDWKSLGDNSYFKFSSYEKEINQHSLHKSKLFGFLMRFIINSILSEVKIFVPEGGHFGIKGKLFFLLSYFFSCSQVIFHMINIKIVITVY